MYNGKDADPPNPEKAYRLRQFVLACGNHAFQHEVRLSGGKIRKTRPKSRKTRRAPKSS